MTKHSFPVVLLCLTLVLALLVTGLGTPGFLVPLLSGKQTNTTETLEFDPMAEGHSKPFRIEPVPGVTISAEENALDKDRTFTMEPLSTEKFESYQDTLDEIDPLTFVHDAWHLDAGLSDEDLLPGTFQMQFDLDALGVSPENYENYVVYRVDDSGLWYEYASGLDGSVLTIDSNQNCDIVGCLIAFAILFPIGVDIALKNRANGYFKWNTRTVDVKVDDKVRYKLELDYDMVLKMLGMADEGVAKDLAVRARTWYNNEIRRRYGKSSINELTDKQKREINGLYQELRKELEDKDPTYQRIQREMQQNTQAIERHFIDNLQPIEKMCELLQLVYPFLKDELMVRVPTYVVRIELTSPKEQGAEGITISPTFGHPYVVIPIYKLGSAEDNDHMLLILTHELFHVSQRVYVFKTRANDKFDEMVAQSVEFDAFKYYDRKGVLNTTEEDHFLSARDVNDYALELNAYKTKYPEGTYKPESSTHCCYPFGYFIHYLMEEKSVSYSTLLTRYKSLFGHREVTTIVKYVFSVDDEQLTTLYQDFALKYQAQLLDKISKADSEQFAPYSPKNILSPERVLVREYKHDYTIRIRRLSVCPRSGNDKKYAIVLVKDDGFDDVCGDIAFTPLDMKEFDDYKLLDSGTIRGLFITEHEMKNAGKVGTIEGLKPDVYLMEADGGSSGNGWFSSSQSGFSLYALYAPEEPEWEIEGTELKVDLSKLDRYGDKVRMGVVDSYVITLRIGETQVFREQIRFADIEKDPKEPWKLDISTLKLNGQKLTDEQREALVMDVQECVTDTYQNDPCLGPCEPIPLSGSYDIFGKWDVTFTMNSLDHNYLEGIISAMPPGMREAYEEALQAGSGQTTKAVMTVTKLADESIEAVIDYEDSEAPDAYYAVAFDPKAKLMTLTPKQQTLTDPMELHISGTGSDLTFTCKMKYQSSIVDYDADMAGTKIKEEVKPTE
ncbi:MAG: hypothetical protein J5851_03555 [Oscillospiraceae bacterium]|nr:hypothetical protein [Oscillospiraceae bacterium]